IGAEGVGRQLLHDGAPGLGHRPFGLQQGRLEGGGGQGLEIAPADLGIGILAADHLALLGDADLALHRARRLGQDGLEARPAGTANSPSMIGPQCWRSPMVSNKGTMSTSSRASPVLVRGRSRPTSFSSTATSRMSETLSALEIT